MKIMIVADEDKKTICAVFARTPYFMLSDTDKDSIIYLNNPACEAESGAGIKAAQFVLDTGADILITPRLGEKSAEILKSADIKIYKADGKDIIENLKLYNNGKLTELTKFHSGYQGV